MSTRICVAAAFLACLSGCAGSESPTASEINALLKAWYDTPGVVEWKGGLEVGGVIYACGAWVTARPPEVPITVDLIFASGMSAEAAGPDEASLAAVQNEGGSIVREFAFRGVRATLVPPAIERLVAGSSNSVARAAFAVPTSGSSNFRVGVTSDQAALSEVIARVEELGGVVTDTLANISLANAVIRADRLLDLVGTRGVRGVDISPVGCLH